MEELRDELHQVMDSQDQDLCLKISMELDEAILEYIRGGCEPGKDPKGLIS